MKYLLPILIGCWILVGIFFTQHTAWTEMLVYPYLLNHGFILYKDLIVPYTPLFLWFLQGLTDVFGYTPQVSLGLTLALAAVNTTLIYAVSQSLWKDRRLGIASAAFYAFWFFYFEGNGLWFEAFQTPFIIGSFYYLYSYCFKGFRDKELWLGSFLLALSFFIKQSVVWIFPVVLLWIIASRKRELKFLKGSLLVIAAPVAVLFILVSLVALAGGYLSNFWQWSFVYTFWQFPFTPGHSDYPGISQLLKLGIPLLSLVPLSFVALRGKKEAVFSLLFLGATFMPALPRWGLFHLQPFLAIMAIAFVPFGFQWAKSGGTWKKLVTIGVVLVWAIVVGRQTARFWNMPVRFFEPQIYQVAAVIESKGYQDFFTFNSSDQLYLLTGTTTKVKPYVQNFAWYMEVPGMQDAVVRSLEEGKPQFVIFSPFAGESGYNIGSYRPEILGDYIDLNYRLKESLSKDIWVLERIK